MTFEPNTETLTPNWREQARFYIKMTKTRRMVTFALRSLYALFANFYAEGVERLPAQGGVILAANHLSNYDVFPIQFSISRPIYFMAKAELFRNPAMNWLLRRLGGFPVYRGGGDDWAFDYALQVLKKGEVLGMFPEGTRSKGKGLKAAKTGVARLAQASGCPILPVGLHGPQYMFKDFPNRTQVTLKYGELIFPEEGETHLNLTDRLMFALAALLPEETRGAYAYHPPGF